MKAKCNKTLIFGDGSESFTKGKEYSFAEGEQLPIRNSTRLIDNQGDVHGLSLWHKHFKLIQS